MKNLKTDTSMAELMPWMEAEAFADWVQGLSEEGASAELSFPEHEMEKKRYYFDGWYCTAAMETADGGPVMVSWTLDGLLQPQVEGAALPAEVKAVQEAVEALMEELMREEKPETAPTEPPVAEDIPAEGILPGEPTPEQQPEPDPVLEALYALLQQKKTVADVTTLIGCLLDYEEETRILATLQSTQSQSQSRLEDAKLRLTMGSGSQDEVDTLQLQTDAYKLRITQSEANQAKALLALQELVEFDPAGQDLAKLLICFDPVVLVETEVCEQASGEDQVAVKASLINLRVLWETVQYAQKTMERAGETVKAAADAYARGDADQLMLDDALCAQSDAVAQLYSAWISFTREVNTLNGLTKGWLAAQVDWHTALFADMK